MIRGAREEPVLVVSVVDPWCVSPRRLSLMRCSAKDRVAYRSPFYDPHVNDGGTPATL